MNLNEYQEACKEFARYPCIGNNIVYTALALSGEIGEYNEHLKKSIRDHGYFMGDNIEKIPIERREKMKLELGDICWYVARNASELGLTLEEVAQANIDKLKDRKLNGKKQGSG